MNRSYISSENLRNTKDKENRRRSTSCSPYSKNFKPHIAHDQRELISHRQHVKKLLRSELEDKYLELLDENFSIKRENLANHDNIRKLITKVLRLSSDGKNSRINSSTSKQNLSTDEDLQIRIIDLESYNAQLKEKLNFFIKNHNLNVRSASVATMRTSSASLFGKSKVFRSQDNLHNHAVIGRNRELSGSIEKMQQTKFRNTSSASAKTHVAIPEVSESDDRSDTILPLPECDHDKNEIKELKELIEKLQQQLIEEKNQANEIINNNLLVEQMMSNETNEKLQLQKMHQKLIVFEEEIIRLNEECRQLRQQNELNSEAEHNRIFELNSVLEMEISKNKQLIEQKNQLEAHVDSMDIIKQEVTAIKTENELLKQHRDNISSLANEVASRNEKICKLLRINENLSKSLSEAKESVLSFENCQRDTMKKIQELQDRNDELTVQIEGFRAENFELAKENVALREISKSVLKQM